MTFPVARKRVEGRKETVVIKRKREAELGMTSGRGKRTTP